MPRPDTYAALYELAQQQDGYFSTYQADEASISRMTLVRAVKSGSIVRLSRGVYRLAHYPFTSDKVHLWEAILWPQVRAPYRGVLSYYTALRMHDLSDVNPPATHITVPRTLRAKRVPPSRIVVHRDDLAPEDVVVIDGLPTTSIARTLRDIATTDDRVALHDAVRDARAKGLPIPSELTDV